MLLLHTGAMLLLHGEVGERPLLLVPGNPVRKRGRKAALRVMEKVSRTRKAWLLGRSQAQTLLFGIRIRCRGLAESITCRTRIPSSRLRIALSRRVVISLTL